MFFTASTFGLHLTVGEQGMPADALLGYRRSECTIVPIPVPTEDVRSVYADINISNVEPANSKATSKTEADALGTLHSTPLGGVHIRQSFATGRAAEKLASLSWARAKLLQAASLDSAAKAVLTKMNDELEQVVHAVTSQDKPDIVDARKLERLVKPKGKPIAGTEGWVERFGNKPVAELRKELISPQSNCLVPDLAKKSKALESNQ